MAVLKASGVEVIDLASLASSATSTLANCTSTGLDKATQLCFTVVCTFNALATAGAEITLWPSRDGTNFDSAAWNTWAQTITLSAGNTVTQTTLPISPAPKAMKVKIENLDGGYAITNLKVYAIKQTAG